MPGKIVKIMRKRIDIVNILCFTLNLIPIDLGWGYFATLPLNFSENSYGSYENIIVKTPIMYGLQNWSDQSACNHWSNLDRPLFLVINLLFSSYSNSFSQNGLL